MAENYSPSPPPAASPIQRAVTFIRQRWLVIGGILLTTLLVLGIILRLLTPTLSKPPVTPTLTTQNFDGSKTIFTSVTFSGTAPELPSSLPLVLSQPSPLQFNQVRNQLIAEFNLQPNPTITDLWSGPEFALDYNEKAQTLHLIRDFLPEENATKQAFLSSETAIQTAQDFFQTHLPNLALVPQTNAVLYFSYLEDEATKTPNGPVKAARVPFTYQVNNVPFYFQSQSDYPFRIDVSPTPGVTQAFITNQLVELKPSTTYPLLTIAGALDHIRQGQASIITVETDSVETLRLNQLHNVDLTSVTLEYRIDPTTQTGYPFYRFRGTALDSINTTLTINVITPAIETTIAQ